MLAQRHAPELATRLMKVTPNESELSAKDWAKCEWIRNDWTMGEQKIWAKEEGYLDDFDS